MSEEEQGAEQGDGSTKPKAGKWSPRILSRAERDEQLRRWRMTVTRRAAAGGPIPHVTAKTIDSVNWVRLVKVSGTGGLLTGLGVSGGPNYHQFRVEIDGDQIVSNTLAGTGLKAHVNNGIGVGLPFGDELVVYGRDKPAPSALAKYWVAYVTEGGKRVGRAATAVETIDGKEYRYGQQRYRNPDGSEYTVESLLGVGPSARVELARDWVGLDDFSLAEGGRAEIAAAIVLSDVERRQGEPVAEPAFIHRPGRETAVSELTPAGLEEDVQIWLPGPGEYSIATQLQGYVNVPSFFTVA